MKNFVQRSSSQESNDYMKINKIHVRYKRENPFIQSVQIENNIIQDQDGFGESEFSYNLKRPELLGGIEKKFLLDQDEFLIGLSGYSNGKLLCLTQFKTSKQREYFIINEEELFEVYGRSLKKQKFRFDCPFGFHFSELSVIYDEDKNKSQCLQKIQPINHEQSYRVLNKIEGKMFFELINDYLEIKDIQNLVSLNRYFEEIKNDIIYLEALTKKVEKVQKEISREALEIQIKRQDFEQLLNNPSLKISKFFHQLRNRIHILPDQINNLQKYGNWEILEIKKNSDENQSQNKNNSGHKNSIQSPNLNPKEIQGQTYNNCQILQNGVNTNKKNYFNFNPNLENSDNRYKLLALGSRNSPLNISFELDSIGNLSDQEWLAFQKQELKIICGCEIRKNLNLDQIKISLQFYQDSVSKVILAQELDQKEFIQFQIEYTNLNNKTQPKILRFIINVTANNDLNNLPIVQIQRPFLRFIKIQ